MRGKQGHVIIDEAAEFLAPSAFEADLDPYTRSPRLRLNFPNGWSASIVLRMAAPGGCSFSIASIAAAPTGEWGIGKTELGETEALADEVAAWLFEISQRPAPAGESA